MELKHENCIRPEAMISARFAAHMLCIDWGAAELTAELEALPPFEGIADSNGNVHVRDLISWFRRYYELLDQGLSDFADSLDPK
mgnify:CR=1 FL=1